jgi:hypothetical protein
MPITNYEPDIYFAVQPHNVPEGYGLGEWVNLSGLIVSGERTFDASSGSWNITLKVPYGTETQKLIERNLHGGDAVKIVIANHQINDLRMDRYRTFRGYLRTKDKSKTVNPDNRSVTYIYTLQGDGWASGFNTRILSGTALQAKKVVKVPRADGATTQDTRGAPMIPGMITVDSWAAIMSEVWTAAFQTSGNGTGRALRVLLQILMNNLWKNPLGEALIDQLSWGRFDKPKVFGIPWRIVELTMGGSVLTPDSILRQIANESYNEIMYDYDLDKPSMPAIVFRPRPYGRTEKVITFEVPNDTHTYVQSAQSGAERFNYFRSNAAMMSFNGIEILIDNKAGHSPIIDQDSVERFGLRPVMPSDDFFPPMNRKDSDITEYYVKRIRRYRDWYYNNQYYLSGIASYKGVIDDARIGTYAKIPDSQTWPDGITTDSYMAYVIGITERFSVHPQTRAVSIDSTLRFVRGEPSYQLEVPKIDSWKKPVQAAPIENQSQPSEHITWDDLACNDAKNTPVPESLRGSMRRVAGFVEKIATALLASTITVISGYRTETYNTSIGGAKKSRHITGEAIDFTLPGKSTSEIMDAINALRASKQIPQGWAKEYPQSSPPFVHYDIRNAPVTNDGDK